MEFLRKFLTRPPPRPCLRHSANQPLIPTEPLTTRPLGMVTPLESVQVHYLFIRGISYALENEKVMGYTFLVGMVIISAIDIYDAYRSIQRA